MKKDKAKAQGPKLKAAENASQICPECGLCCNSVLFGDVRLRKNDHPSRLRKLGIRLQKQGSNLVLPQPCQAFDGARCSIYEDRPLYCRQFVCLALKRANAGEMTPRAAISRVRRARACANKIEKLLDLLDPGSKGQPLSVRQQHVMVRGWDGNETAIQTRLRSQLFRWVDKLVASLQKDIVG